MLRLFILALLASSCFQQPEPTSVDRTKPSIVNPKDPTPIDQPGNDIDAQPAVSGEEFFQETVVEAFGICERCHAGPEIPVERDRGPVTIFNYQDMKVMLAGNTLLPMLRGTLESRPHPVNDPCLAGLNSSPCKEVAQWWDYEFLDDPAKQKDRPLSSLGAINSIGLDGVVSGWAIDPQNKALNVEVRFFVGQTQVGSEIANLDIFDNDNDGSHGFRFTLNDLYRTGQNMQLRGVVMLDGKEEELTGSPYLFAALPKNPQGEEYFINNAQNLIQANCGCHGNSLDYAYSWDRLATPLRTQGGNETNNRLYEKASGRIQHAGGNSCQGNQTCQILQAWWQLEFGS